MDDTTAAEALARAFAAATPKDIVAALRTLDETRYDAIRKALRYWDEADYEGAPEVCPLDGGKIRHGRCRECGTTWTARADA